MIKRFFLIASASVLLLLSAQSASAQSRTRKVEIGGQFTILRVSDDQAGQPADFVIPSDIQDTLVGGGIRIGYNITNSLAVEAEGNIFKRPLEDEGTSFRPPSTPEGRRSQGLFGIKWGWRGENAGVFAKARPGFMRFDSILTPVRSPLINVQEKTNTYFALDLGGVVEAYPSPRTIIRFDAGDTIIRYTNRKIVGFDPGALPIVEASYGHNFQFSAGVGFRF